MYAFLKSLFASSKSMEKEQAFQKENNSYLCPFCFHKVGPTQDCPSCGARLLNSEFWEEGIPMMAKSSVDNMDLLLWKSGNTGKPNNVLPIRTNKDVPAYLYSESAIAEHERFISELEESSRPKIGSK